MSKGYFPHFPASFPLYYIFTHCRLSPYDAHGITYIITISEAVSRAVDNQKKTMSHTARRECCCFHTLLKWMKGIKEKKPLSLQETVILPLCPFLLAVNWVCYQFPLLRECCSALFHTGSFEQGAEGLGTWS